MTSQFVTRLIVEELDTGEAKLVKPLYYKGNFDTFIVPVGFVTDFASVPRLLWWLFPPRGKHTKAAVLHDYLYREAPEVIFDYEVKPPWMLPIVRRDADGLFYRSMREDGTRLIRAWIMWKMVRLFGRSTWNQHRKRK